MENRADAELVIQAQAGDKQAFGCLIERYQTMARQLAFRLVVNESIAKELAQEAMLQAYLSLKQLREANRFKSWLYGIVLNVCRSHLRSQKIDSYSWEALRGGLRVEVLSLAQQPPDPQVVAEEQELYRLVLAAVQTLSPKNRAATLLFYYEQLTLQEIAATLNISVGAVKGRLFKARKQLRTQLRSLHDDLRQKSSRRTKMIKVTIADVIIKSYAPEDENETQREYYIVVLLDEAGQQVLPIWIGPWEGKAIAIGLRDFPTGRPLTFKLMADLLTAAEVTVEEVRVEALKDDTFYGVIKLRNGEKVQEVDARPSDAMALALHTNSPILVEEGVMKMAGIDVSQELAQQPALGKGLDAILAEMEDFKAAHEKKIEQKKEEAPSEDTTAKTQQEIIAQVFGRES